MPCPMSAASPISQHLRYLLLLPHSLLDVLQHFLPWELTNQIAFVAFCLLETSSRGATLSEQISWVIEKQNLKQTIQGT